MAEARPAPWKRLALRPYQEEALGAWNAAAKRGVVVLPTGAGKTRLALSAMATSGLRSLCLVPTRALLEPDLIGPQVFALSASDLVGSYLSTLDVMKLFVELTAEERRAHERWRSLYREPFEEFRRQNRSASWESFLRTASRSEEGRRAVAAWSRGRRLLAYPQGKRELLGSLLERHRTDRVMVFVGDNETAYNVAREFLIMPLTCDIRRKERASVLDRFREGRLRALVSARVLNEGIDVPEADVGIVVAGRMGGREHVQRVGRLLRPRERKSALVYELLVAGTAEVGRSARLLEGLVGVGAGSL
jgi:superfamily II DNA or RNA helicase